ncbi:MAG: hypothetical protein ACREN5_08485 [Gemmatimonadales bacterium]
MGPVAGKGWLFLTLSAARPNSATGQPTQRFSKKSGWVNGGRNKFIALRAREGGAAMDDKERGGQDRGGQKKSGGQQRGGGKD